MLKVIQTRKLFQISVSLLIWSQTMVACSKLNIDIEDDRLTCGNGYDRGEFLIVLSPEGKRLNAGDFEVLDALSGQVRKEVATSRGCIKKEDASQLILRNSEFEWGIFVELGKIENRSSINLLRFSKSNPKIGCDKNSTLSVNRDFDINGLVTSDSVDGILGGYKVEYQFSGTIGLTQSGELNLKTALGNNKPFLPIESDTVLEVKLDLLNKFDKSKNISEICRLKIDVTSPSINMLVNDVVPKEIPEYLGEKNIAQVDPADSVSLHSEDSDVSEIHYCLEKADEAIKNDGIIPVVSRKTDEDFLGCSADVGVVSNSDNRISFSSKSGFWKLRFWGIDKVGNVSAVSYRKLLFLDLDFISGVKSLAAENITALLAEENADEAVKSLLEANDKFKSLATNFEREMVKNSILSGLLKINGQNAIGTKLVTTKNDVSLLSVCEGGKKLLTQNPGEDSYQLWNVALKSEVLDSNLVKVIEAGSFVFEDCLKSVVEEKGRFRIVDIESGNVLKEFFAKELDGSSSNKTVERIHGFIEGQSKIVLLLKDNTYSSVEVETGKVSRLLEEIEPDELPLEKLEFMTRDGKTSFTHNESSDLVMRESISGKVLRKFPPRLYLYSLYFLSEDEKDIYFVSASGEVQIWNIASGLMESSWKSKVNSAIYCRAGNMIGFSSSESDFELYDVRTGVSVLKTSIPPLRGASCAASSDGSEFFLSEGGGNIRTWKIGNNGITRIEELNVEDETQPDRPKLVTYRAEFYGNKVSVFNQHTSDLVFTIDNALWRESEVTGCRYISNSNLMILGFEDGTADIYDTKAKVLLGSLSFPEAKLQGLHAYDNGKKLILFDSAGDGIYVWDVTNKILITEGPHFVNSGYKNLDISNDLKKFAVILANGTIRIYDEKISYPQLVDPKIPFGIVRVGLNSTWSILAIADTRKLISIWDIENNKLIGKVAGLPGEISYIDFVNEDRQLEVKYYTIRFEPAGIASRTRFTLELDPIKQLEILCEKVLALGILEQCGV